jgi:hypothetical protein
MRANQEFRCGGDCTSQQRRLYRGLLKSSHINDLDSQYVKKGMETRLRPLIPQMTMARPFEYDA